MSTTQVHITLEELDKWSRKTLNFGRDRYIHLETFIQTMEQFPPSGLLTRVRPLVVDEAVDPEDLVFWIKDEETGETHAYNPNLGRIFSLVYERVDPKELEGLKELL